MQKSGIFDNYILRIHADYDIIPLKISNVSNLCARRHGAITPQSESIGALGSRKVELCTIIFAQFL